MRTQDEDKKQALFEATVSLVNEIGFAASSVSRIAKRAGVSPSTLYVYHKNKDDLLVSTYVAVKMEIGAAIMAGFDDSLPLRDFVRAMWFSLFDYILENKEKFMFAEQFASTPYSGMVDHERLEAYFKPILDVFQRGIDQKIIKNVRLELISAFISQPISYLANPRHCHFEGREFTRQELESAFTMAWDAIKY